MNLGSEAGAIVVRFVKTPRGSFGLTDARIDDKMLVRETGM